MRLLLLSHAHGFTGGAERSLLDLANYLEDEGHIIKVIVPAEGDFTKRLDTSNLHYQIIPFDWWVNGGARFQKHNANAVNQIASLIQEFKPDICLTNTIVAPWLAYASALHNIRHIWCIREYGDRDHGFSFDIGFSESMRSVTSLSDKLFVNSEDLRSYIVEKAGVKKGDVGIIYPYVQGPDKNYPSDKVFKSTGLKAVMTGNIRPSKGQLEAVKGFAWALKNGVANGELIIVGKVSDKKYFREIKDYIKREQIQESVTFAGFQNDPYKYTVWADIVLVCSPSEAFGRVTIEAMLAGTPVIGRSGHGTSEIIKKGTGFLYENGFQELGKLIVHLYNNPVLRKNTSEAALTYVAKAFSRDSCYADIQRYLSNISPRKSLNLYPVQGLLEIIDELKEANLSLSSHLEAKQNELHAIHNSKRWKLLSQSSKITRLPKKSQ